MSRFEQGGHGPRFSADADDDIFSADKRLKEAWREILKRFFLPKPANDNEPQED